MDDLSLAVAAAEAGTAVVRRHLGRVRGASLKGRNDPVTDADRESEEAIVAVLRRERPGDAIIAEEGGGAASTGRRWFVDPLDGTVNFVHGIPQIGVSVALYEGPVAQAAAVVDVVRDEVFAAAAGAGTQMNGVAVRVSAVDDLERSVIATGFPYDHHVHAAEYTASVTAVLAHVNGLRRFGSAALDMAWVAAGRFDGYWEFGLAPWDLAAGILLVQEAGGKITDPFGESLQPERRLVVAANAALHEPLRLLVASHVPPHLRGP